MSFSCPHYDPSTDRCDRVRDLCVCGRPGCVLALNSTFAIPPAQRLADPAARPPGSFTGTPDVRPTKDR